MHVDVRISDFPRCLLYLFKLGLWKVEVRALHYLRELCVQPNAEVQHATVDLHFGCGGVSGQAGVVDDDHPFPHQRGHLVEVHPVLDLLLQVLAEESEEVSHREPTCSRSIPHHVKSCDLKKKIFFNGMQ